MTPQSTLGVVFDAAKTDHPADRLPAAWRQPARLELSTGHHLRPLTERDVDLHLRAVLESRARLWRIYGGTRRWPPRDLSIEQDRADLARGAADAEARRAFGYGVFDLGETELLGCLDVRPAAPQDTGPSVSWWVVDWLLGSPLECAIEAQLAHWVADFWPPVQSSSGTSV